MRNGARSFARCVVVTAIAWTPAFGAGAVKISPKQLKKATVGVPYEQQLSASGGSGSYSWTHGAMPPGIAFSTSDPQSPVFLTGLPTVSGTYEVTIAAADLVDPTNFDSETYALAVALPPLEIVTSSPLPGATVGASYGPVTLSATGGAGTYTWSLVSGPQGLSVSGSGIITGTPTQSGSLSLQVAVTDGITTVQKSLSIAIAPAITITSASPLPGGTVGIAYSQTLTATGGTPPLTWSLASGSLPPGLSLAAQTAIIAGTPQGAGAYPFDVVAMDAVGATAHLSTSITVFDPVKISTTSAAGGTVGAAYTQALVATGGTGTYSWSIDSGALPPGLSITGATITGVPSQAGAYSFALRATDTAGGTAQQSLSITIAPPISIGTTSLPNGIVGASYSQPLSATGGTGAYTWSVASGALPPGVSIANSSISGTPTKSGAYTFEILATDAAGATAHQSLSFTVVDAVKVTTTSAAGGTVGVPYSQPLAATGGTGTYSWSVASGNLPPGLTITGAAIVGTPSGAGTFSFTVRATDTANASADQPLSIVIATPVSITACPAGAGIAGQPYSSSATAAGGQPPYSWSISTGQLPSGLALNSGAGSVTGTPSQPGSYTFALLVTETGASKGTRSCTIVINSPLAVTTGSLPTGSAGGLYLQQLSASGGTAPYSWSITAGALPPGLSLNGSTGQISGTASQPGSFTFTVGVADSAGTHAERELTIKIVSGVAISACPAPGATVGRPYSSSAAATGGQQPYTWSTATGILPDGLTLNSSSGSVSGTPKSAGNFDFSIKVQDQGGSGATLPCTITVRSPLSIAALTLPDAAVRAAYTYTVSASGGAPPYAWSITAGALPPGITLNQSGTISGTPTATGSFGFTLRVNDSANVSAEQQMSITVNPGLTIPACPAPVGETGSPYSSDVAAVGGSTPYSWSIDTGALPAGVNLNAASGTLSGTPSQTGNFSFVVRVSDSSGRTATRDCAINVANGLSIATTSLPDAVLAASYAQAIDVSGGTPPYAWSTAAGGLPPGLFLNSGTGKITGTPTVAGTFSFTVRVNDSAGAEITQVMTLRVTAGLAISDCPLPVTVVGQPYSATATVQSGAPPFTWSLAGGALPDGFTLDPANGTIAGTPPSTGVANYTLSVVDSKGVSAIRACTLSVTSGELTITTPASLDAAVAGASYSATLSASGGVGAYTWSVISGALPDGLALDASGQLAGSAAKTGVYQFSVQVTDEGGNTAAKALTLNVLLSAAPGVTIGGLSDFVAPAQQPSFDVTLDKPYPDPITGTVQLSFTPDGSLGVDDPAIRFSNGSRTMDFTVPANSTKAEFAVPDASIQTGTVAGTIELDVTLQSSDSGTVGGARKLVRIDRIAPRITSITASRTGSGAELVIVGYSTTRDVTFGTFRFAPSGGGAAVEATVQMSDASAQWFQSADSAKFGGEFKLTLPFTFQGGSFSGVTAILNNPQGGSDPASATF